MTRSAGAWATVLLAALCSADISQAATSSDPFGIDSKDATGGITMIRPARETREPAPAAAPQIGNPLWALPLSTLSATQDRPVFSPSRRAPPRAVAAAPVPVAAPPPPPPVQAEPLQLSLIGAIVGDQDAIAVFIDQASQAVVRLRVGQTHAGWAITSILPREATLKRGDQTEKLVIQRAADGQQPGGAPQPPGAAPLMPVKYGEPPSPPPAPDPPYIPKRLKPRS